MPPQVATDKLPPPPPAVDTHGEIIKCMQSMPNLQEIIDNFKLEKKLKFLEFECDLINMFLKLVIN